MSKSHVSEKQRQKSPAEFFADNQNIAGFDNPGKSLYTTVRELVENGLDACESVAVLPNISINLVEMDTKAFNEFRGVDSAGAKKTDSKLFMSKVERAAAKKKEAAAAAAGGGDDDNDNDGGDDDDDGGDNDGKAAKTAAGGKRKRAADPGLSEDMYYLLTVGDNGCGMSHDAIPRMLGVVLSGSKYGVRQTRGKFGLGAKMALIWSKKSTGVPVTVKTAFMRTPGTVPERYSECVLDIDVYKNEPRIERHESFLNADSFQGTSFTVCIGGNWRKYKQHIMKYLQQLAIITPYADFSISFTSIKYPVRNFALHYERRSTNMPRPALEVKHHPSSVNNLLIQQIIDQSKETTLLSFLTHDLAGVKKAIAQRIIAELSTHSADFTESMSPKSITPSQISRLVQVLKAVQEFAPPDGSCLSPAGEYNLSLGITNLLSPEYIATASEKAASYEGHPFIVECAVALGGGNKEHVNVTRYANRIPLLFEAGNDVATVVANKEINWGSYFINKETDKIGVFVSIVSTKIPFKGTGKEYIGDDIEAIKSSVKKAVQSCCRQLKEILGKKRALKDLKERRNKLIKYVPDASRAVIGLLEAMAARKKARKLPPANAFEKRIIDELAAKKLTVKSFEECLKVMVDLEVEKAEENCTTDPKIAKSLNISLEQQPVYLKVMQDEDLDWTKVIETENAVFVPSKFLFGGR